MDYYSIEDYLRGSVDFEVTDNALRKVLYDRNIEQDQSIDELSQMIKDLAYADILMWATTTASMIQGEREGDNGWSYQAASKTLSINDKKRLEDRAMQIYKQYSDPKAQIGSNKIIMRPL